MKRIFMALVALAVLFFAGCRASAENYEKSLYYVNNDTVYLRSTLDDIAEVKTAVAGAESISREVVTAGTVQAIPTQFAYVAPPFSGRITKSYVKLGQKVNARTPLFEIISPDFTQMQKEYFQAVSEREMARKDLERKKELISRRLCSEREYEEAENEMAQAEKEYENCRAALKVYHVDPDNMALGQPLVIHSPISGEVIENNIVVGMYLSEDAEPVALVADLGKVWITAQVKEKDIRYINEGDKIVVNVTAFPDESIEGEVFHIEEVVDEDTRSIRVLSVCDNNSAKLKLGMYATVNFFGPSTEYSVVSEKAILQSENHSYVLHKQDEGILVRRPVNVDFTREGKAYVSGGLYAGDVIVGEGGYYFQ